MTLELGYLSEKELIEVVRQRARALGWTIAPDALPLIACRGRGDAKNLFADFAKFETSRPQRRRRIYYIESCRTGLPP